MALPKKIESEIEDFTKSKVSSFVDVSGGCINQAAIIGLENKEKFFVKWNDRVAEDFFSAEEHGLDLLGSVVSVPRVVCVGEGFPFIVLEYLEKDNLKENQSLLGELLAKLHSTKSRNPGLEIDNFIGLLPQQNRVSKQHRNISWAEFFIEYRLKPQSALGEQNGWFTWDFAELFKEKYEVIKHLLESCDLDFCLLHGDLWTGNIHWSGAKPYLIDPAVYYGSREADIAFMMLFGNLTDEFFESYNMPMSEGFEIRKHVLNLYHLMNHANIFGGQYVQSVWSILKAL
jgi:protein-ribulosamine 3-kinase